MVSIDKVIEALQQNMKFNELLKLNNPFYVQQYIEDMLVKSLSYTDVNNHDSSGNNNSRKSETSDLQILELHDFIIIRYNMPEKLDEKNIKAYISGNFITVKLGEGFDDKTAVLPKPVAKEGVAAAVKNHILEIKIPLAEEVNAEEIEIKCS